MKKYLVYSLVVVLLAVVGTLLWLNRDNTPTVTAAASPRGTAPVGDGVPAVAVSTGQENVQASQTDIQGSDGMEVDANGHLKITVAIRKVFDYYLASSAEVPVNTITARIRAYLKRRLKSPAEGEAEHILDGYINYTQALANIHATSPAQQASGAVDPAAVKARIEQDAALRSEFLSPDVIQAFFGDEDVYSHYSVARIQIMQNKSLTDTQRAQQLAALQQQLPQSLPGSLKIVSQLQKLQSLTDDCKQKNCTPAELRQARENLVGPVAAAQFEAADQEQAAWDQRMSNYLSQRDAIRNNQGLSDQDKQRQIDTLRKGQFNDTEQIKVTVLEYRHDR